MKLLNKLCTTLLLSLIFSLSFAATYKWTDETGQVIYGENPPVGVDAEKVITTPPSSTASQEIEAFEDKQAAKAQAEKERQEALKLQQLEAEKRHAWKANCYAAKNKLTSLQEKPKVRKRDTYGQLSVMPDNELASKVKEAQAEVDLYCNPPQTTETE